MMVSELLKIGFAHASYITTPRTSTQGPEGKPEWRDRYWHRGYWWELATRRKLYAHAHAA